MLSSFKSLLGKNRTRIRNESWATFKESHIPVDDTVSVEVLESEQDLRGVELGLSQRELLTLNVQHEITTADVLHDEINTSLRLET